MTAFCFFDSGTFLYFLFFFSILFFLFFSQAEHLYCCVLPYNLDYLIGRKIHMKGAWFRFIRLMTEEVDAMCMRARKRCVFGDRFETTFWSLCYPVAVLGEFLFLIVSFLSLLLLLGRAQ
jgi:hypothetical protein